MNTLNFSRALQRRVESLQDKGLNLSLQRDFRLLYEVGDGFPDGPISRLFHPELFDVLPENAFWLHGTNDVGETVHVQAAKLIETRETSFSEVLTRQMGRCFGADEPIVTDLQPGAFGGRCVYHGEMRLDTRFKSAGIGLELTQAGLLMAALEWRPDYICAFFEAWQADRGFPMRAWYRNYDMVGRRWHDWLEPNELFGYVTRRQLISLVELEARETAPKHPPR